MLKIRTFLTKFHRNESGATAIEYGLIAALIGVGIIGAASALGGGISDQFQKLADTINAAV